MTGGRTASPEPSVLGLRVSGGPLFQAAMPLAPGLTVLCGVSGVGKSTALDALYAGLTGRRQRLNGAPLPDDVQPTLLVRADPMPVGALRRSVFAETEHGGADEWLPADVWAMRAELEDGSVWAYRPDHRQAAGWLRSVAITPAEGSAAREVFLWDQQLKTGCRHALIGDFSTAGDLLQDWEFGFPLDSRHLPDLLEHVDESVVFASTLGVLPDDAADRCPLGVDDGLPVSLNGTEVPVSGSLPVPTSFADIVTGELGDVVEHGAAQVVRTVREPKRAQVLADWAATLSDLASDLFECLVLDAPRLSLRTQEPGVRHSLGPRLVWQVDDDLPLSALSPTMLRWAGIAMHLAVLSVHEPVVSAREEPGPDVGEGPGAAEPAVQRHFALRRPVFVLVDAPETSLDPVGVAHLAEGLTWIAQQPHVFVVTASQVPALIDSPDAAVLRVHTCSAPVVRSGELVQRRISTITSVPVAGRDEMGRLGLRLSDLQRRQRAILFVDRPDDEVLLTHFIGDTLARLRVQVIPIGGAAARGSDLDGRFLLEATDALLLPLLSSVGKDQARKVWQEALAIAAHGELELAEKHIQVSLPEVDSQTNRFFARFLCEAIDLAVPSRVLPLGLSRADIVEYLPVRRFAPRATNWSAVKRKHRAALRAGTTTETDWRMFMEKKYRISFGADRLLDAAESLPEPPAEILELAGALDVLVTVLRG